MGELDDKYLKGSNGRLFSRESYDVYKGNQARRQSAMDILSAGVGDITSRDQIINPYDLIDPNMYENTRRGRALYESDLAALMELQKQQNAAYEEFFNSPEQAAIREREAGLNPDLIGLENSGDASTAEPAQTVPGQNLPTNGQMALNGVSGIASVVGSLSSIASLATAFTNIPILRRSADDAHDLSVLQAEALSLSNRAELVRQISGDISGLLGTAVQSHLDSGSDDSFDYDSWFSNDDNFSILKDSYGTFGGFSSALALARQQSLKFHKDSATLQKETAQNEWDFGNIIADPRLSGSQKLTSLQLRPYVQASTSSRLALDKLSAAVADFDTKVRKGMDVNLAIEAANDKFSADSATSSYTSDYYSALSGELVAKFENYVREVEEVGLKLRKSINDGYLSMFESDPHGIDGYKAAYLFGSNGGSSWEEAYYMHNLTEFADFLETNRELLSTQLTNEKWSRWLSLSDQFIKLLKAGDGKGAITAFKLLASSLE